MEKIIITGNCGFLGKRLEETLRKDYEIIPFSIENGKDVTKKEDFSGLKAGCLVHLAAINKRDDKRKMFDTNVNGTLNALEFCKENSCRIIFISSCAVYGNQKSPIKEEAEKIPVSFYGLTKLNGEELCRFYNKNYNVPSIILRLFNLYGINQERGFIISDILSQLSNPEIRLGNPNPRRDFVYVDDAAEAIAKSLQLKDYFEVINIGSGKSHSIGEIAKKIAGERKVKFLDITPVESDIYADVEKAEKILHWQAKTSLGEGLKYCLER